MRLTFKTEKERNKAWETLGTRGHSKAPTGFLEDAHFVGKKSLNFPKVKPTDRAQLRRALK